MVLPARARVAGTQAPNKFKRVGLEVIRGTIQMSHPTRDGSENTSSCSMDPDASQVPVSLLERCRLIYGSRSLPTFRSFYRELPESR